MTLAGQAPAGQPTPGPWRIAEFVENKFSRSNMRRIRSAVEGDEHGAVCEVYGIADGSVAAANARLIAASPRLLQAAQDAYLQMLSVNDQWTRLTPSYQVALCQLRDSIAAATGRGSQAVQGEYEARATGSQP